MPLPITGFNLSESQTHGDVGWWGGGGGGGGGKEVGAGVKNGTSAEKQF